MRIINNKKISFFIFFVFFFLNYNLLKAQGIPKPGEDFISITKDGMWTWYGEPKAVYFEGKYRRTYMTWTQRSGTKGIAYYDHDTKDTMVRDLPKMPYGGDDHNHPSIIMRPDGKILIFCTGHDGTEVTELISKNPEDITEWEPAIYPASKSWFCYPNAIFLKDEGDSGRFYLFFRDSLQEPWFTTSDDWGRTWKNPRYHLFHVSTYPNSAYKPYVKYASNNKDEIHIVIERQNRQGNAAEKPIYFAKYKKGVFYSVDGKQIATINQLPLLDTQLDTIFYAYRFGCSNTCYDVAIDSFGNPVIVMDMFKGTDINIYWYMRWTGKSWYKRPLINSGAYRGAQSGFAAGITLDHENPNILYMCRQILKEAATPFNIMDTSYTNYTNNLSASKWIVIDSVHELDKWVTKDGGVTWDTIPITRNSANKNFLPCVPRNHKEANARVNLIWLNGIYTSMSPDGYNAAVRMFPFKDNEIPPVKTILKTNNMNLDNNFISICQQKIKINIENINTTDVCIYSIKGEVVIGSNKLKKQLIYGINVFDLLKFNLGKGTYIILVKSKNSILKKSFVVVE